MKKIFVDTSALFALLNTAEPNSVHASEQWSKLLHEDDNLLTTNYIVVECIALIQNRLGFRAVEKFISDLLPLMNVVWMDEEQHAESLNHFLLANRRNLSLVDCSSFDTMRRLDIQTVFTFYPHFREQGFNVIP